MLTQALLACVRFLVVIGPKSLLHLCPKTSDRWLGQLRCDAVAGDRVVKRFFLLLRINSMLRLQRKKG